MAEPETSQLPVPPRRRARARGGGNAVLATALAVVAVLLGTALLGALAGLAWAAVTPRALLVVVSRGSADVVNPETSAFIAADGWYTILCLIGGVVSGLAGYLLAVRRHGPLAMASVLAGGLAAALIARWVGERPGVAAFNHQLAAARPGLMLRAPLELGSHGALAFWPLAAGLTAGGIEGVLFLRERRARAAGRAGDPVTR